MAEYYYDKERGTLSTTPRGVSVDRFLPKRRKEKIPFRTHSKNFSTDLTLTRQALVPNNDKVACSVVWNGTDWNYFWRPSL
jgi:hypothetical protein